jgi:beta-1,4-mannosyl-glycoprotein beta-1,4-N-acetylglucosaminyltransferase
MRIVDCCIFYNEIKMLEVRLKELYDYVDAFVIVEATRTFKGDDKPLFFQENKHLFTNYLSKIHYIIVNDMPDGNNPWEREYFQRNCMDRGIQSLQLQDNDILILSDCDEIINCEILKQIRLTSFQGIARLKQDLYYYNLYNYCDLNWDFAMLLDVKTYNQMGKNPQSIRYSYPPLTILSGGWHFSFFGGTENIISKIQSYAHQELNTQEYTNPQVVQESIQNKKDIFNREYMKFFHNDPHNGRAMPINYKMLL